MLNIIKSDLFRILRGKAIYIAIILMIVMTLTSVIGMSPGYVGISVGTEDVDNEFNEELRNANTLSEVRNVMKKHCEFELDKEILGSNTNLYYFFIVIVVIVICTDFSNKSIKNTLSSAISRKKYYFSKLILVFVIGTALILINNYGMYILNIIINGKKFSSNLWEFTKVVLVQLPLLYGIISLLVSFAFIFRKTSTFNTVAIPFVMVVQLIGMGIINLFKINGEFFYNYELQYALANLVTNPANDYIIKCTMLGIMYIIVFNLIGYFTFKKVEIK